MAMGEGGRRREEEGGRRKRRRSVAVLAQTALVFLARQHGDLRDIVCEDDHARGGSVFHDQQRESEDPSRGGHPSPRTTAHQFRSAIGRRPHVGRVQHQGPVDVVLGAPLELIPVATDGCVAHEAGQSQQLRRAAA